jgi:hypothetical protein
LGTDQTISDEVLAAASEGLRRCGVEVGSVGGEDYRRHIARGALLAAVPHIEAAIRQADDEAIRTTLDLLVAYMASYGGADNYDKGWLAAVDAVRSELLAPARGGSR